MPKKKKEGRSLGLVFSLILHGSIVLLVLVWGINRYKASDVNQPISVSLSALDYKGSSPDGGDTPRSVKSEKPKVKEDPKKEEKPEVKEEPKKEVKKEPEKEEKKEEPPEEEIVKEEEPPPPKEEPKPIEKKEPDKKIVALEEKKEEPKKEVKKEPKKEPKKEVKKKEPKPKPKQNTDEAKTARDSVINELKRKSVIDKLGKTESTTQTASAKDSPGLRGNDNEDVAGSTGKVNTALINVYSNAIQRKIEPKFRIPPNIPKDGSLSSDIFFRINERGKVSGVKVARSSGNPAFDNFCINTVISSSPLPAPPSDISKLVINEGFQITLRNDP